MSKWDAYTRARMMWELHATWLPGVIEMVGLSQEEYQKRKAAWKKRDEELWADVEREKKLLKGEEE